jgi:GMP synthase-like glutamine amidotransferase
LAAVRILAVVNERRAGPGVFADARAELDEWVPAEREPPALDGYAAVMAFGGSMNVDEEDEHPWLRTEKRVLREALDRGLPILGVCLGSQLLAEAAGAAPHRAQRPEIGWHEVEATAEAAGDPVLGAVGERFEAFQWHSYQSPAPPGAVELARNPACLQGFRLANGRAWGIQFHAEVTAETVDGWLEDYRSDPNAVRIGLDPETVRAQTPERISAWNDLGRDLARRFVAVASH